MLIHEPFFVFASLAVALLVDLAFGGWIDAALGPSRAARRALQALEGLLRRRSATRFAQRLAGALALALFAVPCLMLGWLVCWLASLAPASWLFEGIAIGALLNSRARRDGALDLADALHQRSDDAAAVASRIAPHRNSRGLGPRALARATIEEVAGGWGDGLAAPLFWALLAGLPGAALYKAFDWSDMVYGRLSPRYRHFGAAAATLDDLAGWLPMRLAALAHVLAIAIDGGAPGRAIQIALSHHERHPSPNKSWLIAATAGGLGVRLGGPRAFGTRMVDAPWIGDGRAEIAPRDVRSAARLTLIADLSTLGALVGAALVAA